MANKHKKTRQYGTRYATKQEKKVYNKLSFFKLDEIHINERLKHQKPLKHAEKYPKNRREIKPKNPKLPNHKYQLSLAIEKL